MRQERDFIGALDLPDEARWGIHTARAVANFPITGQALSVMPELIRALALIKKAAAQVNAQLGRLEASQRHAIVAACEEVLAGQWQDQFVVDALQGGAGTSTNMNANEVIANRALALSGHARGRYDLINPVDHVNAAQSTNDVYPTAIKLATLAGLQKLDAALERLQQSFAAKGREFADIVKIGRTQLQDAVPMTLGQEFTAFAVQLADAGQRLRDVAPLLYMVNLGGTAIGTSINAQAGFTDRVVPRLAELSGFPLRSAPDLVASTSDASTFVEVSGVLRRVAVQLSKICNDLRLLSSGPQAGFGDIRLPASQAGSSIMPGKVNPVIPEVVNQVAFEVMGNDLTIAMAAEAGQLQLNAFEPVIAWSMHKSLRHLGAACDTLRVNCVEGIEANTGLLAQRVEHSVTVVTALNPVLGYETAALLAKQALATGASVPALAEALGVMGEEDLRRLLSPQVLTRGGVLRKP
jgi:aspartate ammonia-lyase